MERSVNPIALQLHHTNSSHAAGAILFVCLGYNVFWQPSVAFTTEQVQWEMPHGKRGMERACRSGVGGNVGIHFVPAWRRCTELDNVNGHIRQKWTQEQDYPTWSQQHLF